MDANLEFAFQCSPTIQHSLATLGVLTLPVLGVIYLRQVQPNSGITLRLVRRSLRSWDRPNVPDSLPFLGA